MKFKTTSKAIKNGYGTKYLFKTGYCALQNLFYYDNPIAYTSGMYGWNFDLYDIEGVGICTGYRGMVGQQIDYAVVKKYDDKACEIVYKMKNDNQTWEEYDTWKKQAIEELKKQFIKELFGKAV